MLAITGGLIVVTSLVVYDLERVAPGATIKSWPDGMWWALSTVTTVGYGDKVPITAGGRAVAVVLMLAGVALLGVITAAIAATFVAHSQERRDEEERLEADIVDDRLAELIAKVSAMEALLLSMASERPTS